MTDEIERKFLIKKMPDISNIKPIEYERYYVFRNDIIEMRIQKKGDNFEIERKEIISKLKALKTKLVISRYEFEKLKSNASQVIYRTGYKLSRNPNVSIKIYHGKYEGLKKVEIEFNSEEEANKFKIPTWYGKEITNSIISRDSKLLNLSEEEFNDFIIENK